jgi:hypothetical protein
MREMIRSSLREFPGISSVARGTRPKERMPATYARKREEIRRIIGNIQKNGIFNGGISSAFVFLLLFWHEASWMRMEQQQSRLSRAKTLSPMRSAAECERATLPTIQQPVGRQQKES